MNHQPFEEWLLNDKHLTTAEKRELDAHLRACKACTALAETGLALRATKVATPAAGFSMRFQQRLAAQKLAERRRRLWGLFALILSGAGLLGWLAAPYLTLFLASPVEWITAGIGYTLFIFTSLQAFTDLFAVLARVMPDFIPPYVWMMVLSALAGLGLLWIVSIWRFTHSPQGVSV